MIKCDVQTIDTAIYLRSRWLPQTRAIVVHLVQRRRLYPESLVDGWRRPPQNLAAHSPLLMKNQELNQSYHRMAQN